MNRIPGKALIYTYRGLDLYFANVAGRIFQGGVTVTTCWPGVDGVDLQKRFYRFFHRGVREVGLAEADFNQIIARCSVLRLLPQSQARRMVTSMCQVIDELYDHVRPDYLLTVSVDNYVTDLLARRAKIRNIRTIMLLAGTIPNTTTITSYGEFQFVREPGEGEVQKALSHFLDDHQRVTYHQSFAPYTFWTQFRLVSTWWLKRVCFKALGFLHGDPLNFRYLMGSISTRDGQSSLRNSRCAGYFDQHWEDKLSACPLPTLFIPLSYTPEASVSYWLGDLAYLKYEEFILDACRLLGRQYHLLVKEHWAALGVRRWEFYRALKQLSNVTIIPAEVNSRHVMSKTDRVLVGAGTAGIEAAVRGKRVVTLDKPYYFMDGYYLPLGSAGRLKDLPTLLEEFRSPVTGESGRADVVRKVLQSTFRGTFLPGDALKCDANISLASEGIRNFILSRLTA